MNQFPACPNCGAQSWCAHSTSDVLHTFAVIDEEIINGDEVDSGSVQSAMSREGVLFYIHCNDCYWEVDIDDEGTIQAVCDVIRMPYFPIDWDDARERSIQPSAQEEQS